MALHWAWGFGISGDANDYIASGWEIGWTGVVPNMNFSGSPYPRQPLGGSGGMTKGISAYLFGLWATPAFPNGTLSDGQVQLHWRTNAMNAGTRIMRLLDSEGNYLLELRPVGAAPCAINVYTGEGVSNLTLRGTTTGTVTTNTWYTIAVRFKKGTSGGEIAVSIDGVSETIVSNGNTGVTSDWARVGGYSAGNTNFWTGITAWDDGAGDDALTVTRWVGTLRATADDTDGSWTRQTGSATDLYLSTRADPLDPGNTYCQSTTDPDECRFAFNALDATYGFGSSWYPDDVEGVVVAASMRGQVGLNTGRTVIDDGVNNLQGASATTDPETSSSVSDLYTTQADGSSGWDRAALSSHTYGVRAS